MLGDLRIETLSGSSQVDLAAYLDATAAERATDEANAWIKALRHLDVDGLTLRNRFRYRGASLWWFTELSLAKERIIAGAFRTLAALETLIERESPQSIEVVRGTTVTRIVVAALAKHRSIPYTGPSGSPASTHGRGRDWASGLSYLGETLQARLRPPPTPKRNGCDLAIFVHSAFWQVPNDEDGHPGSDVYIGPVIRELQRRLPQHRLQLVGIGPRVSYRARDRVGSSAAGPPALPVPADRELRLLAVGVVVSAVVASATHDTARHARQRGSQTGGRRSRLRSVAPRERTAEPRGDETATLVGARSFWRDNVEAFR